MPFLHLIACYYFVFAPSPRRHMRAYLRRALGREPRARDRYRLIFNFATTILDRLYLLAGQQSLFEITLEGEALIREVAASGGGALLFGAHMGSFEVLRALGHRQPGLQVAMAMYETMPASSMPCWRLPGRAIRPRSSRSATSMRC